MDLFKIMGTIAINNSEANAQIDETSDKAESFGSKLASGIKTVGSWGAAIVGGATAATGALVSFATQSASTADHIDKMSQKIGISRQAYQELDFICSQSGTSVDSLQMGIKTLTAAMDGAREGTEANVAQFERLGVAVTNADGSFRSQEDVFFDTITALQGIDDQTEKARLATELFGRSGTELMPLLNGASGSIEEMKQQAHDLGLVLDDELIDNGVNLTDSLDQTKRAFQSILTKLGGALMPAVEQASDYIQRAVPSITALVERLSPIITNLLESLLPPLMELGESIFPTIMDLIETLIPPVTQIVETLLPVIVQILQMLLPPLVQIVSAILPIIVQLIAALAPLIEPILTLLQPIIDLIVALLDPLVSMLNTVLPPLITVITFLVNVLVENLKPVIEALAQIINDVLIVAFDNVKQYVALVTAVMKGDWEGAKQALSNIWENIKGLAETLWEDIKNYFNTVLQAILGIFSSIWDSIKGTVMDVVNAIASFLSSTWESIKTTVSNALENVKTTVTNAWENVKTTISNAIENVKTTISNGLENAKTTVSNTLDNIKQKFTDIWEGAKSIVSGAIEAIKGFMNFDWKLPDLKLPHISISGEFSLTPPSVPSFGIEWYKKAVDNPMLFTEPTLFGLNPSTGAGKVAGEAGDEMMYGHANLMDDIAAAVAERNAELTERFDRLINLLSGAFPEIMTAMNRAVVLDSGAVVGELAPAIDQQLGVMAGHKGRGN